MNCRLTYGIVSDVKPGYVKVYFDEDEIATDWLPVLVKKSKTDKESWALEIQEHVVCLMDEYCNTGVCLGAIANQEDTPDPGEVAGKFRKQFSDGTLIQYDKNSHELIVDVKGNLTGKIAGSATIEVAQSLKAKGAIKVSIEAPDIDLVGNVKVAGTAIIIGSLQAASIATVGGGSIISSGNMQINGSIQATGDIVGLGKSLSSHIHGGVQTGGGNTLPPS